MASFKTAVMAAMLIRPKVQKSRLGLNVRVSVSGAANNINASKYRAITQN